MNVSVGAKIWLCLSAILLLLLGVGGTSYSNTKRLMTTAAQQTQSNAVLTQITVLLSVLQEAETGQRGYIITGEERYLAPFQTAVKAVDGVKHELRSMIQDNPVQIQYLNNAEPFIQTKFDVLNETIAARRDKGFEAAQQLVLTDRGKAAMDSFLQIIQAMQTEENVVLQRRANASAASSAATMTVIWGGGALGVLIVLAAGLYLASTIAAPLRRMTDAARRIGSGDLTQTIAETKRSDEIGILSETLRQMQDNLRQLIAEIIAGAQILAAAGSQIVATTAQVAAGAAETATSLAETSSTMEEVKKTSQLSSEKAVYVAETAQKTAQISQGGRESVALSIDGINRVRVQIGGIAEAVMKLSEQSQAIGEIVATVNDLAEQSNLLAVNAAIEAGRAGEHGRGFVVVAQEVKSLAEQSKQATSQVRVLLSDIQKATATAVLAAEQGSKAVDAGVKQSIEAGSAIERLAESITTATQAATQIMASNRQQQTGIDQVALAMETIKEASAQNMMATRQAELAARNLNELGQKLKAAIGHYKA